MLPTPEKDVVVADQKKIQWYGMIAQRKADLGWCRLCRVHRRTQKEQFNCIMRYEHEPE